MPQINAIPQIIANAEFAKTCEIANQKINALIKSGSDISCCNSNVLETFPELKNKHKEMFCDKKIIMTANSTFLPILGKICMNIRVHNVDTVVHFYLVEGLSINFILGLDWLEQNEVKLSLKKRQKYVINRL